MLGGVPVFVKPARCGSSIGVTFVESDAALEPAIELALRFDDEVVVEVAVTGAEEVNCAVLRDGNDVIASVLELVAAKDGFLSYDQKYLQWSKGAPVKGVQGHAIPAPLPSEMTERITDLAKRTFEACMCDGVVRVDFLVKGEDVFVNELNTVPGSLAFYLWEASGIGFEDLLGRMLKSAIAKGRARNALTYTLERNLLADIEQRKGAKRP
jgi:D-alanine-D-alanine ligase